MSLSILLTGATSGVGLQLAKQLTLAGHRLIAPCRSPKALLGVLPPSSRVMVDSFEGCDLTNFDSVKATATAIRKKHTQVDVICLMAGVLPQKLRHHAGIEEALAVNHLGQMLLVHELLPLLLASPNPRLVIVASGLHAKGDSLPLTALFAHSPALVGLLDPGTAVAPPFNAMQFYGLSKLYNVLTARAIASRAQQAGKTLWVASVTPGFIPSTGLSRDASWLGRLFMSYLMPWAPFCVTVEEGARRVGHVVTSLPALGSPSGTYWAQGVPAEGSAVSRDPLAAEKLFGLSMQALGLTDFLGPPK
mmetsp:Transcript_21813/g.37236  ORF Transcript_21813/g.37236 Transcript_21813/m.37236 type:complete len:305 (-) Transcript_21813:137-1051(-)|eukprot:CAMPEP_0119101566 /NCGR_PEP_ID=MMETSP1180-20130426/595_1 /TAXON_ID=3052 ORGANISM="Chlamydomonas cf sp, Strain CCMP681" /NCGR_SAMPLE_ID=MMETSP1180 /ASSEMBLY_ACC=CAM_ASM_000741 /LENGTH=304 /DNA_ID=CAMNT_0007085707 /DNA_START=67 /DNA_END=981 /DNA_ORIENTATION=+